MHWRPKAELALTKSTVKFYGFQLDRHIIPALGTSLLCSLSRVPVEFLLSNLRPQGHAVATICAVRATLSTVLQSAVERGYLDQDTEEGAKTGQINGWQYLNFGNLVGPLGFEPRTNGL